MLVQCYVTDLAPHTDQYKTDRFAVCPFHHYLNTIEMYALESPTTKLKGSLGSAIVTGAETSVQKLAGTMDQLVLSATPPMAQVRALDYSLQVRIGAGTSGDVYQARCKETDRVYAVKIYREAASPQGFLWNHVGNFDIY